MNNEEEQESQALIPIEQQTIMFRGLPLVVVRLPDGRPKVGIGIDVVEDVPAIDGFEILDAANVEVAGGDDALACRDGFGRYFGKRKELDWLHRNLLGHGAVCSGTALRIASLGGTEIEGAMRNDAHGV